MSSRQIPQLAVAAENLTFSGKDRNVVKEGMSQSRLKFELCLRRRDKRYRPDTTMSHFEFMEKLNEIKIIPTCPK